MAEEESNFSLTFYGLDADQHRLDLYDAGVSSRGFARTLAILGHYYITGEIISHAPRSDLKLYVIAHEEGSFKQNVLAAAVGGIIATSFGDFAGRLLDSWIPNPNFELQQVVTLLQEQNRLLRQQQGLAKEEDAAEQRHAREVIRHLNENNEKMQVL
ncbi:MAG: DUF7946 domain-containing protein, partial [Alphaproteobacteria bacterium]